MNLHFIQTTFLSWRQVTGYFAFFTQVGIFTENDGQKIDLHSRNKTDSKFCCKKIFMN